ncbi:selenoprotein O [Parastagonospora nodorum]|nr:selenoprotein O [Parastagonospora nodorum]KAH4079645.1 selenoprotein O [Parastagonospora nodorum]KAH4256858.1 selenoprotein O [Parastagonospora nodorum]KAH4269916.1 selenoprotein O [Parastagonospora nodorum]KAH4404809.1 selenoprotein O [Parastagonospora nodorum]
MAHLDTPHASNGSGERHTLRSIPKSNVFTQNLPTDDAFPTPKESHDSPRQKLGPRMVKDALYTYVRPDPQGEAELLAVSQRALQDLGLSEEEAKSDEFKEVVSGKKILTWDESKPDEGVYPWAQCYGGYQFGQWAGQLGDGRAISLFETTNPSTKTRYEIQLKGAGRTPYSRFADGRAVLRSSIREFVVSEYLNAINIPTTRALSLTLNNGSKIMRERIEPGAIVARFAQSWIRFGTFDLQRMRGDRNTLRTIADYTAEHVYGGWDKLPSKLPPGDAKEVHSKTTTGIAKETLEGEGTDSENRYARLYRAILRANALTVAKWQAYGFMNGVLNTDNTSILGLSIDFGPFAFLDTFDPTYTPNHDDHMLRYSYRNQPTIIWWNLVRLGEALGELMGAGAKVDDGVFVEKGVHADDADELVKRAETVIDAAGEEYKAVFLAEYRRLMTLRLGLKTEKDGDFEELMSELLDCLEAFELDFHHAFRRLSSVKLSEIDTEEQRKDVAGRFFRAGEAPRQEADSRERIGKWLGKWAARVKEDWGEGKDEERRTAMDKINPKFVPRSWILDELIDRVEKKGEREILPQIMKLALNPFEEHWAWDEAEEERFCGDVPKYKGMMQCSCSS